MKSAFVITTIQSPTRAIRSLARLVSNNSRVFIIGDKKTPKFWRCPRCIYFSLEDQSKAFKAFSKRIPLNSYSRKMLGYLLAAKYQYDFISETDDDNYPFPNFIKTPPFVKECLEFQHRTRWLNPYLFFSSRNIWPRGLPLEAIGDSRPLLRLSRKVNVQLNNAVVQFLAEGDPDVDAIYRLTVLEKSPFLFKSFPPIVLPKNVWAPFNSQATIWPRSLLPLMYLPVTCSFRMTDIWRSFVAQRIAKEWNVRIIFCKPGVLQRRNTHNLFRDFKQEVEGYLNYNAFVDCLESIVFSKTNYNLMSMLLHVYERLIKYKFFNYKELRYVASWIHEVNKMSNARND